MNFNNDLVQNLLIRSTLRLVDGFYVGLAEGYSRLPITNPALYNLTIERDIPYLASSRPEHRLDILRPKNTTGPLPVLFYIHGGGFRTLSKETHFLFAMMYARMGFLVVNINYRLAPAHPFPAAIEDTCAAYCPGVGNSPCSGHGTCGAGAVCNCFAGFQYAPDCSESRFASKKDGKD